MTTNRLKSLDILRGFDLFILVAFQPLFMTLAQGTKENSLIRNIFNAVFTHVEWTGFHAWDQVMPLFVFMSGVSIPFAFSSYKRGEVSTANVALRITKRIILLWLFGAIVQGNILDFKIDSLYLYTDTLQTIAMGYLFATLAYLLLPIKAVAALAIILPTIYTIGMLMTGGYDPGVNLAERIDRAVLGKFLYGASYNEQGDLVFASWYHISWIYSTLNFVTTTLTGLLAGCLLKSKTTSPTKKTLTLVFAGASCLLLALALSNVEPIIKRLWTSSMTFLSSGISLLLMAISYYIVDVKQYSKGIDWLRIYGMNSILAYMMFNTFQTNEFFDYWLHGFKYIINDFYPMLLMLAKTCSIFLILRICYRHNIFLKV